GFKATVAEVRKGAIRITGPGASIGSASTVFRHLPTNDLSEAELVGIWNNGGTISGRYKTTSWNSLTFSDSVTGADLDFFPVQMASLHGKLFMAYPSAQ